MNRSLPRLVALCFLVSILLAGCQHPHDLAWERSRQSGVLRVGTDASYPPFETLDASGAVIGFDADLAREIGQRIGLEVSFTNLSYDGLYDALIVGRVDVLISALVVAPEAEQKAVFSHAYFDIGEQLVAPARAPLTGMEALEGLRVAVEYGAEGDVLARQWQRRLRALEIVRCPDSSTAIQAVLAGEADAALIDGIAARLAVGQHPELAHGATVENVPVAVAVHPDSTTLLAEVNTALDEMQADGTIDRLTAQWFGPQR
ncbi:MAG: amino acid ABC transporter substrate-binding protein [Anaerolineae bacterium]|nr:amino acid ABC transporter substrate-binding protein [Anaerolineae bacterium]